MAAGQPRPETNLVVLPLDNIYDAHRRFGEKSGEGYTPIAFIPRRRSVLASRFVVPHGFDAVVVDRGRALGVFRPGVYWRTYLHQIAYIVTKQHIPYHFAVRNSPTRDNVRVDISVDVLFHVADTMRFVLQIAPENMEELLRATEAEAVRVLVRHVSFDEAYDLRGHNSEQMLSTLNATARPRPHDLNAYGVVVDQVTIAGVSLPADVAQNMQQTTTYESKQALQAKRQALDLKRQGDEQQVQSVQQARANQQELTEAMARKERSKIEHDIEEMQTRTAKDVDLANARLNDQLAQIKAQCESEIGMIAVERDKLVSEIKAEGEQQIREVRIQASKDAAAIKREAMLRVGEIRAKILQAHIEAERRTAAQMKPRRENDVAVKRLSVVDALSGNKNATISGESGDNALAQLLAATRAAQVMGIKITGKAR
eukprot:m51a1_g10535 hypothetical protein (428) ;mRNA; f:251474-253047